MNDKLPFSGVYTCSHCSHDIINVLHRAALAIACEKCKRYYRAEKGFGYKSRHRFSQTVHPDIPLHSRGRINGVLYEIVGFAQRKEIGGNYPWREYMLYNPAEGFATLAEYNGHWNYVKAMGDHPRDVDGYERVVNYRGRKFQIYNRYKSTVNYAAGEFPYDLFRDKENRNTEWIAPPFMLIREKSTDQELWSLAEYQTAAQIKGAFGDHALPEKTGVGATQLMKLGISFRHLFVSSVACIVLLLAGQLYFNFAAANEKVFSGVFNKSMLNKEGVIVSPPFELKGFSSALQYDVYAAVENNWFDVGIELINDETGERFEVAKSLEFYKGYDDGLWTEGSQSDYIIVSSVPGGRYHLNIYPQWGPSLSEEGKAFELKVFRDVSLWGNFWILSVCASLLPLIQYLRLHAFEASRWSGSGYSPSLSAYFS